MGPASRWSRREHEDRAGNLARLHGAKRLVHVLEPGAHADHLVQLETALVVEVDVLRHVDLEVVAAHGRALDLLLAQEYAPVQLDLLTHRDHADDRRRATRAQAVERLLSRLLETDRFEAKVDAVAGDVDDR